MFHDIKAHHEDIESLWNQSDITSRSEIGEKFFTEQISGTDLWKFTKQQKRGVLPENWDPDRRNIAIFPSSEFEFAAISSTFGIPFYENQNSGIKAILSSLENLSSNVHLNVRVHPHLKNDDNESLRELLALKSPNLTVIPPTSPVSTYDLMFAVDKVVTFASTAGIEAVYWGKPSILVGTSFYQDLGGTYNPESHDELIELLHAELQPKPKEAALKYGFHELQRGAEYAHFERDGIWKGRYKSKNVEDMIPLRWRALLLATQSRFGPLLNPLGRLHQRFLRRKLGIPTV